MFHNSVRQKTVAKISSGNVEQNGTFLNNAAVNNTSYDNILKKSSKNVGWLSRCLLFKNSHFYVNNVKIFLLKKCFT